MNTMPLEAQLGRMITGYWVTQAIYAAAKLGIADHLTDGPQTVGNLAQAIDCHEEFLFRLLRALASVGIFTELEEKKFGLTPLAELLQSDVPNSQRALALMMGGNQYRAWGNLANTVKTGDNAYEKVFGKPIFDHLAEIPEEAKIFDQAMTGIHGRETAAVLEAYDFSEIDTLADIGCGNGSKLIQIMQKYPELSGIYFDLPHVIERALPNIETSGLLTKSKALGGNFFKSVPAGADAYIMRHIIHDWDDEKSLTILKNCYQVMSPGNKLLLVESVIPPGNEPFMSKLLDLTMMLIPGGKERTEIEYRELYEQAGFTLTKIVPTTTEVSVIEGVRN